VANEAHNRYSANEIDLHELLQTLWQSKVLIVAITLVVTCIAGAYAIFSMPVYRTTVQTLPPTASNLASYNIASQLTGNAIRGTVSDPAPRIEPLTPQDAYKVFLRYLNSNTIRQGFFDNYYLPAQDDNYTEAEKQRAWKQLDDELTIRLPKRPDEYEASLSLEGYNSLTIAKWANAYVELAVQAASKDILSGLAGEVNIRKLSLEDQINTLRKVAEKIQQDRIVRLREALAIAESINLETPHDGAPFIALNSDSLTTENINSGSLLYLRGVRALRSELQQLEGREATDAYIAELPDLLKKQALLSSINLNPELISVATIDRAAVVPEEPIKPQKALITILGFFLGLTLGVFFVLIRKFASGTR